MSPKQHLYHTFAIALPDARPVVAHVGASTNIVMMGVIREHNRVAQIHITDITTTAVTKDAGHAPMDQLAIDLLHVLFQHEEHGHRDNE